MSFIRRILVSLGMALALVGCSGTTEAPPIRVGHVATGPEDGPGASAARGIRLAVMEANKDPDKVAGRPVEVIHTDTLGKLEAFESQAVRLATINRVAAILGGTTLEEVERLEMARVPVISPCGVRPRTRSDAVFCTGLSPAFQGKVLARFAAQELKAPRVAVLADEARPEAVALAEAFAREFLAASTKVNPRPSADRPAVWRYGKETPLPDLTKRVQADKTEVVLLAGKVAELKQLRRELGDGPALLFGGDEGSVKALRDGAAKGKLFLVTAFAVSAEGAPARAFAEKYKKTFSEEADAQAAVAYDDARMLFEAMRRAKDNLTRVRIREELAKLKDFAGVTGTLSFGEDGLLRRPAFIVRLENGQSAPVKRYAPEE